MPLPTPRFERSPRTVATLLLCLGAATGATAQTFICPSGPGPGQRQVGMSGGGQGLAPVPVCANVAGGPARQQAAPTPPPEDPLVAYARSMMQLSKNRAEMIRQMKADPEYKALETGYWTHYQASDNAPPGQYCTALFKTLEGAVQIVGPGGAITGGLLSFWGLAVPQPDTLKTVRVDLKQEGVPVQNVSALNYTVAGGKVGVLSFSVPTIEAGLATMRDTESFKVTLDGKVIVDVAYHSGLKARDEMRACLAKGDKR